MLTGKLTLILSTEEDILLAARIIEQRTLAAKSQAQKPDSGEPNIFCIGRTQRPSNEEVLRQLKMHFQAKEFSRAEAITEVKRIAGYSPAKTGRILRTGIERNELHRVRDGWYAFTTSSLPPSDNNDSKMRSAKRAISEKQRSKLRTLQNSMLYMNFVRKLKELNPEGLDEHLINRDMEPGEALNDLKKRYPNLILFKEKDRDFKEEFREYLATIGIDSHNIQDLVIARMEGDNPFNETELKLFAQAQRVTAEEKTVISLQS